MKALIKRLPNKKHLAIFFVLFCGIIIGITVTLSIHSVKANQVCITDQNGNGQCNDSSGNTTQVTPAPPRDTTPNPAPQGDNGHTTMELHIDPSPTASQVTTSSNTTTPQNNPAPCAK